VNVDPDQGADPASIASQNGAPSAAGVEGDDCRRAARHGSAVRDGRRLGPGDRLIERGSDEVGERRPDPEAAQDRLSAIVSR
jgi:hypothetical protein